MVPKWVMTSQKPIKRAFCNASPTHHQIVASSPLPRNEFGPCHLFLSKPPSILIREDTGSFAGNDVIFQFNDFRRYQGHKWVIITPLAKFVFFDHPKKNNGKLISAPILMSPLAFSV